jgi:hypothetical protein
MKHPRLGPCLIAAVILGPCGALAELAGVEVAVRADVAEGRPYGLAGAYEKLRGRMHFVVDPEAAANGRVHDLGLAPRNRNGLVEFSADYYLLKPKDMGRANGTLLFEVSNRGGKGMLSMLNDATGSLDPTTSAELGDGFLLERGYSLLWVGWQFDPPDNPELLRVYPPRAVGARGPVRSDFVVRERAMSQSLGDRGHRAYPVADPGDPGHVMTVRDTPTAERREIPRDRWQFARYEAGRVVADAGHVYLEDGFEPHKIYEVVYSSVDPPIAGLGLAAIRDAVAGLKLDGADALGLPRGSLERAIAFGISQSGRLLRTFLYDGFNGDERGRKVFDGVMPHIAGGARGSFNHRFAQASRASWSFFYPSAVFPFADVALTDPATGHTDGLMSGIDAALRPKVIYTNSSNEYWRGTAALIHVDPTGRHDLELPSDVRVYLFAGTQHVPAQFPPNRGVGQHAGNPNDYTWFLRAALVALDDWIATDAPPPPSSYPRIDDGTLVPLERLAFPAIPQADLPKRVAAAVHLDFGPRFASAGIIDQEPPVIGPAYPVLLPQVDADGNEIAGLRSPELAVPLATYTGWNLYAPEHGPADELVSLQGAYLPLGVTRAVGASRGDPRPAVLERYSDRAHYLGLVAEHALAYADAGYLLAEDVPAILRRARGHWDTIIASR